MLNNKTNNTNETIIIQLLTKFRHTVIKETQNYVQILENIFVICDVKCTHKKIFYEY
jgi:hypothetical protein